ncbi:hypothetical protein TruAng_003949 [Truncatella angustata]|nr:hypothetical protein TruAng_003949 [Truncatella angustata]
MAEAVGTALAVVGVLGQIFDGCVKAYSFFSTARSFDSDSQKVVCKIRIEETRLIVWGRQWGVAEGRLEKHLSQVDSGGGGLMRNIAVEILTNLQTTITDVQKLKDRYGLVENGETGKKNDGLVLGTGKPETCPRKSTDDVKNVGDKMRSMSIRARWVVADFNDGLEQLFPASRIAGVQRTWVFEMLQSAKDVEELSVLEHASDEVYPKLNASASLKKLRINLDNIPQKKFKPTYALKVQRHALAVADKDTKRSEAFHDPSGNVLIEWVGYDKEDIEGRVVHSINVLIGFLTILPKAHRPIMKK